MSWTLAAHELEFIRTVLDDSVAQAVTHAEDHHGSLPDGTPVTVGTVTAIKAVFCKYEFGEPANDRTLYPIRDSTVFREVAEANGSEREDDGLRLVAYLVDLSAGHTMPHNKLAHLRGLIEEGHADVEAGRTKPLTDVFLRENALRGRDRLRRRKADQ